MKRNFLSLFIGSIFLISSSVAMAEHHLAGEKDIVDTAVAAGSFSTLVTAVKAAGLVETLKGKGLSLCLHLLMQRSQKSPKQI